jgi:hypothetical protein
LGTIFGFIFLFSLFLIPGVIAAWPSNLDTGLEVYYNFDDGTDLISGNNLTVSLSDPTYETNGLIGNASYYDGNDKFVTGATDPSFNMQWNRTVSFWYNISAYTGSGNDYMMFSNNWYGGNYDDGDLYLKVCTAEIRINTNTPVGNWNHVVLSRNSTGGALYLDGVLNYTCAGAGVNNANDLLYVGGPSGGANLFTGYIDEMGWWGRPVNDTEVTQLYNSGAGVTYSPPLPNQPPIFTVIPANITGGYPNVSVAITFAATDPENDTITWSVNNANFNINQSGYLTNTTTLGGGIYLPVITIDDGNGGNATLIYSVTVTPVPASCTLTSNAPIPEIQTLIVTGTCTNPEGVFGLFRDGVDVTAENGVHVSLAAGSYVYVANVTSSQNYTNATTTATYVVTVTSGIDAVCYDSDITFVDAAGLAGLIMVLGFLAVVITTIILSFTGVIDFGKLTSEFTLERLPAIIIVVGLLFLVIATMSFLIASNVCPAFGA